MRKEEEKEKGILEILVDEEVAEAELAELVADGLVDKEVAQYLKGERKTSEEYRTIVSSRRPRLRGASDEQIETELEKERSEAVLKMLPRVIVRKVKDRVPENFLLKQIVLSGEVSGKPWGIGVSGTVQVVFEKQVDE